MPFAAGSQHGLRFVRETDFGVTPENPDMRALRHTSCSLALSKDSFQSNELRRDAQISDLRHGVKQASGDIGIEFSYGEYDDLLAAAVRGEWQGNELVAGIGQQFFTIERVFEDIQKCETFYGCAVNSLSLDIQTNAMLTGSIGIMGKGAVFSEAGLCKEELPSFTYSPLDGFSGSIREGGKEIAVITSVSLSIDNGIEPANVLGSDEAAALIFGRINITGTVSAYFEDLDLLDKFLNETESELEIVLGNGGPGSYIIYLPRIKYTGGTNNVDGEGPITLDMPFQALLDECNATNIRITRIAAEADAALPCSVSWSGESFEEQADGTYPPITLTLENKEFNGADDKELPGAQIQGLPEGLALTITRTGEAEAKLELSGTAKDKSAAAAVTVSLAASAFKQGYCHCEGFAIEGRSRELAITYAAAEDGEGA